MNKKKRSLCGAVALLLCSVMFLSIFPTVALTATAAVVTKEERSYDIAVVFDNSGSMYEGTNRWCQAKYAMEIFASMLDYGTDKLTIFPMWEVTTDGTKVNNDKQKIDIEPITVAGQQDIDKIANLYTTIYDGGTPFEPVEEAYAYLKKSKATDKWLLVLTDGEFYYLNRKGDRLTDPIESKLLKLSGNGINMYYLGFGEATQLRTNIQKSFYASDKGLTLQENLINSSNMIFQRSVLPPRYLASNTLTADISMKKLIVFAQGKGAKIESLVSESGETVQMLSDSGQRKYSTITGNSYKIGVNTKADESLAGQVVTFGSFKAGKYTLNCSGAEKIQIFYEPDVDMSVILDGPEGMNFDPTQGTIPAGTYNIKAGLKDRETGTDLTNHPLLGNVDLKIKVKTSDQDDYKTFENGASITFNPDEATSIEIEGKYLDDYTISSKDDINLDWLNSFKVEIPHVDFTVTADVLQKDDWYVIKDSASWQPIKVALTVNGQPLTAEQMANTEFMATCSSQTLAYTIEKSEADSTYYIYVGRTSDGGFVVPEVGSYNFSFAGTSYTDEYDKSYTNDKTVDFDIQTYSKIWVKLIWVLIIGGILIALTAIFLSIMLQKVLPGNVRMDWADVSTLSAGDLDGRTFSEVSYRKKGKTKSLEIKSKGLSNPSEMCRATFKIEPVDNRFTSSASRKIRIVDISTNCKTISINGIEYIKNSSGKWVKESSPDPDKAKPISHEISNATFELRNGSEIMTTSTLTCKIKRLKK